MLAMQKSRDLKKPLAGVREEGGGEEGWHSADCLEGMFCIFRSFHFSKAILVNNCQL